MSVDDTQFQEPPRLRSLRIMVMVLTGTMIVGLITIISLLVISMTRPTPVELTLPTEITLPEGEMATAFTQGTTWIGVVTQDSDAVERIHLFERDGSVRQTVVVGE